MGSGKAYLIDGLPKRYNCASLTQILVQVPAALVEH